MRRPARGTKSKAARNILVAKLLIAFGATAIIVSFIDTFINVNP